MFAEIGYIKYLENEDTLIYKYNRETFQVSITFDKREFKKTFHAVEMSWIPKNSETWYTQEFESEWLKYCAAQGHWSMIWHEFTMQELQAINKKCEELGWLDKKVNSIEQK